MKKEKLRNIAPKLSELSRKTGFKVPEKYFKEVEETLLFELKSKSFSKPEEEFNTPEGYFNELEDTVVARLQALALYQQKESSELGEDYFDTVEEDVIKRLQSTPSKNVSIKRTIVRYMMPLAAAASLLLLVMLNNNTDPVVTFDSLATSEIENLLEEGMLDYDAESLAVVFPGVDLEDDLFEMSLSNEEVLDYLNDTDLEYITFDN
jgi:hypothetical protein